MRAAVIGLGGIAEKAYMPLLSGWEGLDLILHARTRATVEQYQAQYRVPDGTNVFDEVLALEPEVAFVLTPSDTHYEIARRLLEAGVHVYLEKPATLRSERTRSLAELAEERDRALMVGFNRRYAPLHQRARELWGGRPVGFCVLEKHRDSAYHPDLYSNYIDDTVHIIDLLRFFCGEPTPVRTASHVKDGKLVRATALLEINETGTAVVATELNAGTWQERYTLHGGGASIYVEAFSELRFVDGKGQRVEKETYASAWTSTLKGRGFEDEIAHFLACVREGRSPRTSAWEALKTQELLEAMVEAADEDRV
jgi:virulence factor